MANLLKCTKILRLSFNNMKKIKQKLSNYKINKLNRKEIKHQNQRDRYTYIYIYIYTFSSDFFFCFIKAHD